MKSLVPLNVAWLLVTVMLGIAVLRPIQLGFSYAPRSSHYSRFRQPSHTSDFYTLLRWVCCATFAYSAVASVRRKLTAWAWIFGGLAVLFNPIAPVHLLRETWQGVDAAVIAIILVAGVVFWRNRTV